jgi:hypothetical protein
LVNLGEISDAKLAKRQAEVLAGAARTVVLVEGLSDWFAIETIAARLGYTLEEREVAVVPMGGFTSIGRFLATFGPEGRDIEVAGLCDAGEAAWVRTRLERAGVDPCGLFVCDRDLEDELLRAAGPDLVLAIIEREGEGDSLRRMQQMPFHRGGAIEGHLHRFIGTRSGRKHRYARLLAEAAPEDRVPPPLRDLVLHVSRPQRI